MMSNEMSEALLQKIDEVKKQMTELETQEGVVLGTYAGQKVIKTAPLEALVKKLYVSTEKYDYNVPGPLPIPSFPPLPPFLPLFLFFRFCSLLPFFLCFCCPRNLLPCFCCTFFSSSPFKSE